MFQEKKGDQECHLLLREWQQHSYLEPWLFLCKSIISLESSFLVLFQGKWCRIKVTVPKAVHHSPASSSAPFPTPDLCIFSLLYCELYKSWIFGDKVKFECTCISPNLLSESNLLRRALCLVIVEKDRWMNKWMKEWINE